MTDAGANMAQDGVFDLDSNLPLRALRRKVAEAPLSADIKALLIDLAQITITLGERVVALGRKIL